MKHSLPRTFRKLLSLVLTAALLVGTASPLAEAYTHASEFNTGYTIYDGIDVSKWQGTINWSKVAAAGIDFVFIRCGYTSSSSFTLNEDPQFATNIKTPRSTASRWACTTSPRPSPPPRPRRRPPMC